MPRVRFCRSSRSKGVTDLYDKRRQPSIFASLTVGSMLSQVYVSEREMSLPVPPPSYHRCMYPNASLLVMSRRYFAFPNAVDAKEAFLFFRNGAKIEL